MSSFIGHALAAYTIGKSIETKPRSYLFWQIWLLLAAIAPDIDYILPQLNARNYNGLRFTHSIGFSLIAPVLGIIYLFLFERKNIFRGGFQVCLAGLSHLILDTLVGSWQRDPLLYPFTQNTFKLPFGILPSAAKISLSNFYLYRNLLIECGILIPVCCFVLYFAGKLNLKKPALIGLISVVIFFLIWSLNLDR